VVAVAETLVSATFLLGLKAGHLFLGSSRPIWNNDGDTATLIDPQNFAVGRPATEPP
jgi:hypothetical protein